VAAPNLEREAILRQAAEAKSLLEHPMLIAALKAMETLSIQEFVRSKPDDHDARTRAYWRSTAAAEFRSLLTRFVTTGRLEEEAASRADVEAKAADLPNTDADTPNARRISL
jgi:hypothetical protein